MAALVMNSINPKKLLNSKWTAVKPQNKEKHFIVKEVDYDELGMVISCIIEAVINNREAAIDWTELKDQDRWQQGWL